MQVLVRLICLVGPALGLQQAVSYQNFRASHGQGHPTYRSDGSWSQSFGGGHRSFGGGFRGLGKDLSALRVNSPFLGSGHQNFGPSTSTYGSVQTSYSPAPSPSTIGLSSPPQYTDPGPSLSPTPATSPNYELQPSYESSPPQGNSLINNNAGPIYSDSPSPSFSPELQSLPPPQGFGNDRLPPYASDAVAQNYNGNGPIHSSNSAPPNAQYSSGPLLLENRGASPEFRSEVQTPQASFQQSGPNTLGPLSSPNPGPDSRSLPYQDTGSFRSDATYSSYDAPRQDFGPGPSHSPGPVTNGVSYNTNSPNSNYATNGRGINLDYSQPLRSHSPDFGPNGRVANPGPSPNFDPNGRTPSGDYGPTSHPNPDYSNGRPHNSNFRPSSVGPSSDIGPNGRIPNPDFRPHGRHPTSNIGFIERGPNTNFGSIGKGPDSDYRSNGKSLNSDITPQGRRPVSDFRPSERGPNSHFGLNGRRPTSDFKTSSRGPGPENRGSGFSSEPGRLNFNDRRTPNFEAGGSNKPFGRPHQSPLDNRGPQTFSQSKPPLGLPKPAGPNSSPGGLKLFDDRKPLPGGSSKFNVDRLKDFGAKRDKPNFSGEEGGQSFEADFKSSELGGQSFEADLPDFPSDDSYFNSGEAYGSFESGGKAKFGSGEAKESLEVSNTPSFDSGEKGFSDRDASFDSQERTQSAETDRSDERSQGREPNRDGPKFRDGPPPGRARVAEEKKLDLLEKKPLMSNADKKSFVKSDSEEDKSFVGPESRNTPSSVEKKDSGSVKDSTSLPYTSDLTIRKPFSGPTSKLFPDKKASFAIERFVPFDKPYSHVAPTKRLPYAVESRIPYEVKVPFNKPFQGNFKRLYKRQPSDEKIVSVDTGTKRMAENNMPVPSEQGNID